MTCMESVQYNFTLNRDKVCELKPTRGLRQGDPISPYLFILGIEGLSAMLSKAEGEGELHGIKVCVGAPVVQENKKLSSSGWVREPTQHVGHVYLLACVYHH